MTYLLESFAGALSEGRVTSKWISRLEPEAFTAGRLSLSLVGCCLGGIAAADGTS